MLRSHYAKPRCHIRDHLWTCIGVLDNVHSHSWTSHGAYHHRHPRSQSMQCIVTWCLSRRLDPSHGNRMWSFMNGYGFLYGICFGVFCFHCEALCSTTMYERWFTNKYIIVVCIIIIIQYFEPLNVYACGYVILCTVLGIRCNSLFLFIFSLSLQNSLSKGFWARLRPLQCCKRKLSAVIYQSILPSGAIINQTHC